MNSPNQGCTAARRSPRRQVKGVPLRAVQILTLSLGMLLVWLWPGDARADRDVQLGAVDRAVVRVLTLLDADITRVESYDVAFPIMGHGSGVLVSSSGLVLTAAHVVEGARMLAVWEPGRTRASAATLVAVDRNLDLAFLWIGGSHSDYVPLPSQPPALRVRQRITAIGYPLDPRPTTPKSTQGIVAGQDSPDRFVTDLSINRGNSGGPVLNDSEELVGIAIQGADPQKGAQGIGIVVPMSAVLRLYNDQLVAAGKLDQARSTPEQAEANYRNELAQIVAEIVVGGVTVFSDEAKAHAFGRPTPLWQRLMDLLERKKDPLAEVFAAAFGWNCAMHLAHKHGLAPENINQLPEPDRQSALTFGLGSIGFAEDALKRDSSWGSSRFVKSLVERLRRLRPSGPLPNRPVSTTSSGDAQRDDWSRDRRGQEQAPHRPVRFWLEYAGAHHVRLPKESPEAVKRGAYTPSEGSTISYVNFRGGVLLRLAGAGSLSLGTGLLLGYGREDPYGYLSLELPVTLRYGPLLAEGRGIYFSYKHDAVDKRENGFGTEGRAGFAFGTRGGPLVALTLGSRLVPTDYGRLAVNSVALGIGF